MRSVWVGLALTMMVQMSSAHGYESGAFDLIRSAYPLQLLRCSPHKPIEGGWTARCNRIAGTEPAPEKVQLTHYGPGPKAPRVAEALIAPVRLHNGVYLWGHPVSGALKFRMEKSGPP